MNGLKIRGMVTLLGAVGLISGCLRLVDFEPSCASSSDCKSDEMCVEDKCVVALTVPCTTGGSGICDYGFVCANSVCASEAAGFCADDYDCNSGFSCVNWMCAASSTTTTPTPTGGCTSSAQCAAGLFCRSSNCTNVCLLDSECAQIGLDYCDDYSTCQVAECSESSHCGADYLCIGGECI